MFPFLYKFVSGRAENERQLLLRIKEGDEAAFKAFYGKHIRSTYYMAYGFTNQQQGARDLGFDTLSEIRLTHASIDTDKPVKALIAGTMIKVYLRNRANYRHP
jgi:hypothetical protein